MKALRFAAKPMLILFGAVMTSMTLLMSAPLWRLYRRAYGAKIYWLSGLGVVTILSFIPGLASLGWMAGSLWLTVGLYTELDLQGKGSLFTAVSCCLLGMIVLVGSQYLISLQSGLQFQQALLQDLQTRMGPAQWKSVEPQMAWIIQSIPGLICATLVLSLAASLIFERKLSWFFGIRYNQIAGSFRLLELRMPDVLVWTSLFAATTLLFESLAKIVQGFGLNILIVLVALFLLQGIAILEVFMMKMRFGIFGRLFMYFFVVGQLMVLVSFIGFIDYWVDFRGRLRRWKGFQNRPQTGEDL